MLLQDPKNFLVIDRVVHFDASNVVELAKAVEVAVEVSALLEVLAEEPFEIDRVRHFDATVGVKNIFF